MGNMVYNMIYKYRNTVFVFMYTLQNLIINIFPKIYKIKYYTIYF